MPPKKARKKHTGLAGLSWARFFGAFSITIYHVYTQLFVVICPSRIAQDLSEEMMLDKLAPRSREVCELPSMRVSDHGILKDREISNVFIQRGQG